MVKDRDRRSGSKPLASGWWTTWGSSKERMNHAHSLILKRTWSCWPSSMIVCAVARRLIPIGFIIKWVIIRVHCFLFDCIVLSDVVVLVGKILLSYDIGKIWLLGLFHAGIAVLLTISPLMRAAMSLLRTPCDSNSRRVGSVSCGPWKDHFLPFFKITVQVIISHTQEYAAKNHE